MLVGLERTRSGERAPLEIRGGRRGEGSDQDR